VIEQLTHDHRLVVGGERTYLSRALGIDLHVEIDYSSHPVEEGDVFVLTTDGVHDHLHDQELARLVARGEPDQAARAIVASALARGSPDNLTCQVLSIDGLPLPDQDSFYRRLTDLPFPPPLEAGMVLDGYRILREIHASKRSQVYLALDGETGEEVVLKTPSVNYDDDPEYIQHFLHEEWVGRRLRSPHVVKVLEPRRRRQWLYFAAEYVSGQTLRQWMHDHPTPSLPLVRGIVQQVAAGLRAFHRMEMTHQDLKPENILLDEHGTVKITDFGSTKIAGIEEIASPIEGDQMLGTENYTAPEYLLGGTPGPRSDLFSLAVITYELLTGRLPYGEDLAKRLARGRRGRVQYVAATRYNPEVPAWVDGAIERAVQIEPSRRYAALSELVHDLSHPNPQYLRTATRPLLERNPVGFWRGAAILLLALDLVLVYVLVR
jgi:serine/threonine protein kinase